MAVDGGCCGAAHRAVLTSGHLERRAPSYGALQRSHGRLRRSGSARAVGYRWCRFRLAVSAAIRSFCLPSMRRLMPLASPPMAVDHRQSRRARAARFLDHVAVVLDVFERALVGQLLEQGFYFLLGNTHGGGLGRGRRATTDRCASRAAARPRRNHSRPAVRASSTSQTTPPPVRAPSAWPSPVCPADSRACAGCV